MRACGSSLCRSIGSRFSEAERSKKFVPALHNLFGPGAAVGKTDVSFFENVQVSFHDEFALSQNEFQFQIWCGAKEVRMIVVVD